MSDTFLTFGDMSAEDLAEYNRIIALPEHEQTPAEQEFVTARAGYAVNTLLEADAEGNILRGSTTVLPTTGTAGFAKGCTIIKTDEADGTTGLYVNVGTLDACDFRTVDNAAAPEEE